MGQVLQFPNDDIVVPACLGDIFPIPAGKMDPADGAKKHPSNIERIKLTFIELRRPSPGCGRAEMSPGHGQRPTPQPIHPAHGQDGEETR